MKLKVYPNRKGRKTLQEFFNVNSNYLAISMEDKNKQVKIIKTAFHHEVIHYNFLHINDSEEF